MTLVFVVMFTVIFASLSGLTGQQAHQGTLQAQDERAFQIAESGLDWGGWRLAHEPTNFDQETKDISDQFAGTIGSFQVTFTPPIPGSTTTTITSVGNTANQPNRKVTLEARYGIPSLARYASVTNQDAWYSGQIQGEVHSNGGIRMDGNSNSLMTSAKATYTCQPNQGCNNVVKPGIWGSGTDQALWEFPVPAVDYNSFTLNLVDMKTAAQTANTYYGSGSGTFGYHVVFNSNNTYSVYKVKKLTSKIQSYFPETDWELASHDIDQETFLETKSVPAGSILYFEDTVWVNGEIRSRITVASGKLPDNPSTNTDIIINGNITYGGVHDGSRVFGAIAQRHVLIPYSAAPDNLTLEGAYVAQKGRFGRRLYDSGSQNLRSSLIRYGMIASNLNPVTAWVDGSGTVTSGYRSGQTTYDSHLLYGPPPYFPTNGQYEFLSWEQVE